MSDKKFIEGYFDRKESQYGEFFSISIKQDAFAELEPNSKGYVNINVFGKKSKDGYYMVQNTYQGNTNQSTSDKKVSNVDNIDDFDVGADVSLEDIPF